MYRRDERKRELHYDYDSTLPFLATTFTQRSSAIALADLSFKEFCCQGTTMVLKFKFQTKPTEHL
jgi:hypothetical protein